MSLGKFIVVYGSNNLGKSTQMDLLEKFWLEMGLPYKRLKYPIYESETGKIINNCLRGPKEMRADISDADFQKIYADNRRDFEPHLKKLLEEGDVLAEDYVGTGLAWGLTKGVDRGLLDHFNAGLLRPDYEILLDGERFTRGIEKGHRHESAEQEVWERNRRIHRELAVELGWKVVNANENSEKVHENILKALFEE